MGPSCPGNHATEQICACCWSLADRPAPFADVGFWPETDITDLAGNVRSPGQSGSRISRVESPSLTHGRHRCVELSLHRNQGPLAIIR